MLKPYTSRLIACLVMLLLLAGCGASSSGSGVGSNDGGGFVVQTRADGKALVSWTPPTQNSDGSTLTDLAGYRIYYGNSPGSYQDSITINTIAISSFLVENLVVADWYLSMTAFNSSGIESSYSAEVHFRTN